MSAPVSSLNSTSIALTDKIIFHAVLLVESVITPRKGSEEVTKWTCLD